MLGKKLMEEGLDSERLQELKLFNLLNKNLNGDLITTLKK